MTHRPYTNSYTNVHKEESIFKNPTKHIPRTKAPTRIEERKGNGKEK
jgi:hypothetical protein